MLDYFKEIAEKYSLSLENVLSIALNRYGIIVDNTDENRLRFNLELLDSNKKTYFAVCVNTFAKSPFKLENNTLLLEGVPVGQVSGIEKDTCLSTYFRNDKKVITFNSNSRSKCVGCKFCGTYSLTDEEIEFITRVVSSHMGEWNTNPYSDVVLPLPNDKYQRFVHMCDFLSSRKFLDIKFENNDIED